MATVDILMATYNGESYIREQIESIQSQSFVDWRLLVSDDCSGDETLNIVHEMASIDSRIKIVSEGIRYGSAKTNFMRLLEKSNAPYVMFCDQDDVWLSDKIKDTLRTIKSLGENSATKPLMVFTDMKVVDESLDVINDSFERFSNIDSNRIGFSQLIAQSVGAGCTMLVNHEAVCLTLMASSCSDIIMHDWWISLVCAAFGKIGHCDKPTSLYRQHGKNEVGAVGYSPLKRATQFAEMQKSVARSVAQANEFGMVYENKLDDKQKEIIREFVAAYSHSGVRAVSHLVRSGCWKKGARKIGQIIVAFRNN